MDARRVVAAFGRALIALGVLLLLFVVYQLWGTNIHEARAQSSLRKDFARELASTTTTTSTSTTVGFIGLPSTTTTVAEVPIPPPTGEAVAIMQIPKIGLDKAIVEGVGVADLKKGPGHYPQTPMPGQPGNAAIAGHRTTYGAPFYRLNELEPGDPIFVRTLQGRFRYEVYGQKIVSPSAVEVLNPSTASILTLTTCNPRYSARERLILVAVLVDEPAPAPAPTTTTSTTVTSLPGDGPTPTTEAPSLEGPGLSGEDAGAGPTVLWGVITAAIGLLAWLAGRRWKRWPAYLVATPIFLVSLFVFYENVARILPANI